MEFSVNFLPVIISAVLFMPFGAFFYSTKGMGNFWMKAVGKTSEELNNEDFRMPVLMGLALVTSFVTVYIISVLIESIGIVSIGNLAVLIFLVYLMIFAIRLKNAAFDGNHNLFKVNMLGILGEFIITFIVFIFFV